MNPDNAHMTQLAKYTALVAVSKADFAEASRGNLEQSERVSAAFHKAKAIQPSITFDEFSAWFTE